MPNHQNHEGVQFTRRQAFLRRLPAGERHSLVLWTSQIVSKQQRVGLLSLREGTLH